MSALVLSIDGEQLVLLGLGHTEIDEVAYDQRDRPQPTEPLVEARRFVGDGPGRREVQYQKSNWEQGDAHVANRQDGTSTCRSRACRYGHEGR